MQTAVQLEHMGAEALRGYVTQLLSEIDTIRRDNDWKTLRISQLTHEMAVLRRIKFAARSEAFNAGQRQLFEETLDADWRRWRLSWRR